MKKNKINLVKTPLLYIGDKVEPGSNPRNIFSASVKMFLLYIQEYQRKASDADLSPYNLMHGYKKLYSSTTKYGG